MPSYLTYKVRKIFQDPFLLLTLLLTMSFPLFQTLITRLNLSPDVLTNIKLTYWGAAATLIATMVFRFFLLYLEKGPSRSIPQSSSQDDYELFRIRKELTDLKDQFKSPSTLAFEVKDVTKTEILETLKASIDERLSEGALKTIDEEFAKRDLKYKQWERMLTGFEDIRKRLSDECENLRRRSNLNLALGSLTTVIAGLGLVVVVFLKPLDLSGLSKEEYAWKVVAHYIPRLSLIIFAEVFAYFFLRLYKAGLSDMKFYQNEMTNVEVKLSALKAALATQDNETIKLVIGELSRTERNFILKKGETTVELQQFRDGFEAKDLLDRITSLVKAK
jgi:hypothetical protein